MARSTLSFFSRLFSSKKKQILEKRNQEKLQNGDETSNVRKIDTLYDSAGETENGIQTVIHESVTTISADSVDNIHVTYNSREELSHEGSENTNKMVSTVEIQEKYISQEIGVSENIYEARSINHENSEFNTNPIEEKLNKDDSIEYDSMVLLSKLEQLMIKLSDNTDHKSMPLVIEALVEMANYIVEFSEQLPIIEKKKILLKALIDRDKQNYKILNSGYIDDKRLRVKSCADTDCVNPTGTFIDLSNDLLRIINVYLSTSVKAFKSDRISEQWKTLYTGFFVNLTKIVRSSQAKQKNNVR